MLLVTLINLSFAEEERKIIGQLKTLDSLRKQTSENCQSGGNRRHRHLSALKKTPSTQTWDALAANEALKTLLTIMMTKGYVEWADSQVPKHQKNTKLCFLLLLSSICRRCLATRTRRSCR